MRKTFEYKYADSPKEGDKVIFKTDLKEKVEYLYEVKDVNPSGTLVGVRLFSVDGLVIKEEHTSFRQEYYYKLCPQSSEPAQKGDPMEYLNDDAPPVSGDVW
jgi:hypothetical protein